MSRTDILVDIKKAEAEAKVTVDKAEADKKIAIANARRDSVTRIQTAEAKMRSDVDTAVAKEKQTLSVKRESLLSEGRSQAEKLDKLATDRTSKVVDFLKKEFERKINVT